MFSRLSKRFVEENAVHVIMSGTARLGPACLEYLVSIVTMLVVEAEQRAASVGITNDVIKLQDRSISHCYGVLSR